MKQANLNLSAATVTSLERANEEGVTVFTNCKPALEEIAAELNNFNDDKSSEFQSDGNSIVEYVTDEETLELTDSTYWSVDSIKPNGMGSYTIQMSC